MYQMHDAEFQVKQQRHRVVSKPRCLPFSLPRGSETGLGCLMGTLDSSGSHAKHIFF